MKSLIKHALVVDVMTRAEMIDWLAHQRTDGYDYTIGDGRIKDNEKATERVYWDWHDTYAKLSTAKLRTKVAMQVINNAI